jgi:hypothetical protein
MGNPNVRHPLQRFGVPMAFIFPGSAVPYTFDLFVDEEGRYSCLLEQSAGQMERVVEKAKDGQLPAVQITVLYSGKPRRPRPIEVLKAFVRRLDEGKGDKHLRSLIGGDLLK